MDTGKAVVEKGIGYTIKVKLEACEYAEKSSNEVAAKLALTTQTSWVSNTSRVFN